MIAHLGDPREPAQGTPAIRILNAGPGKLLVRFIAPAKTNQGESPGGSGVDLFIGGQAQRQRIIEVFQRVIELSQFRSNLTAASEGRRRSRVPRQCLIEGSRRRRR